MGYDLFYAECGCALGSCICAILVVVSFSKVTNENEANPRQPSTPKRCLPAVCFPLGVIPYLFRRKSLSTFSSGIAFISISTLLRSIANLFALLQRFPEPVHSITFCNYEAMLRTFAILVNFAAMFVLSVQLYGKLVPDSGTVLHLEDPIKWFRTVLFTPEHNKNTQFQESRRDFQTFMYFFVFFGPLIIAMLPWASEGYAENSNGLVYCTFADNKYGKLWAGIALYFVMTVLWVSMLLIFVVTSFRLNSTWGPPQWQLFGSMFCFVGISFFIWIPLIVGTFEGEAIRVWEVVIQVDGVLYFILYVYLQKSFEGYDEQFRSSTSEPDQSINLHSLDAPGLDGSLQDAKSIQGAAAPATSSQPFVRANPIHGTSNPAGRSSEEGKKYYHRTSAEKRHDVVPDTF